MEEDALTQEETFPKLFVEESIEIETAATLMKEEVITLPIQSEKVDTSGNKVRMKISQEIVNSDSDDEKGAQLSLLNLEVRKWKEHVD